MKEVKKFICIAISAAAILSVSAPSVFGQSVDSISMSRNLVSKAEKAPSQADKVEAPRHGRDIRLNRKKVKIGTKQSLRLQAFLRSPDGQRNPLRWLSSDWNIARVSPNGTVKGVKPGKTIITVFVKSNPAIRAKCTVTVGYNIKYYTKGGKLAKGSPRVYYNENVVLKKPTRKGYSFKGWYTDEEYSEKITNIEKGTKKNYTLYAKWKK